jgi:hypothetical protein
MRGKICRISEIDAGVAAIVMLISDSQYSTIHAPNAEFNTFTHLRHTTFSWDIPKFFNDKIREGIVVDFFDLLGHSVGSFQVGQAKAGWSQIKYSSSTMNSGAYVCRISGQEYLSASKSFVIVK